MTVLAKSATEMAESGFIPDPVIRFGIRRLVEQRRRKVTQSGNKAHPDLDAFIAMMNRSEIALQTDAANEQHYEVPPAFFAEVLGKHRKYSCCFWGDGAGSLEAAEQAALEITCRRAGIEDGMQVLDLGCGWGSLSLWIAQHYPASRVTAVSNSHAQRQFIEAEAADRGLANLNVITADMNYFRPAGQFDRIVSIEMFEHMRNYGALFDRISRWLKGDGRFFMHIFCHRSAAYEFVDAGPGDWMSRHFFSGGIMPSQDLPMRFQQHLSLVNRWTWDGTEYRQTAEAWLDNMDARKQRIMPILESVYGKENSNRWWMRWRMFFLAVSEMFGSHNGKEWLVGHYLFQPKHGVHS
ncbi:MAG: cyclopropane-fatty-acyl-phospholipid synthase family protein [Gammaproteobacteria bacterium]|nr:cyclopropane-fatty-acyl-phospholipid synthase family protein [Gammaproteobacteria bacterium]MDH4314879.1 cyclopropane-fatty-acyl-phospholipid synthase family protein [Gammaproteobacteria bacterium]MDH5213791.1 cyclopropane-fatty-acyl-phospholipid synthase family protein [Gammaproteobacteria bacterium]